MALKDLVKNLKQRSEQFALETACYLIQHAPVYIILSDGAVRSWLRQIGQVIAYDVAPILGVSYTNYILQDALEREHNFTATTLGYGLNAAAYTFSTLKLAEFTLRASGLTILAGKALTTAVNDNTTLYKAVCTKSECTGMKVLEGNILSVVGYLATEKVLINQAILPYGGETLATIARIYNTSRYCAEMILPMCNQHQMENMQQYRAFVLSMGVGHALMTALLTYGVQQLIRYPDTLYRDQFDANTLEQPPYPDFPTAYYSGMIRELCLVLEMLIAAKLIWPQPVAKATRGSLDPVIAFQHVVRAQADIYMEGLKIKIPRGFSSRLKGGPEEDPWTRIEYTVTHYRTEAERAFLENVWNDPWRKKVWDHSIWQSVVMQGTLFYSKRGFDRAIAWGVFPAIFFDKKALFTDFILGDTLEQIRSDSVDTLYNIENFRRDILVSWVLWLASKAPKHSAQLTAYLSGIPDFAAEWLIKALNNESFINRLRQLRTTLEGATIKPLPPLSTNAARFIHAERWDSHTGQKEEPAEVTRFTTIEEIQQQLNPTQKLENFSASEAFALIRPQKTSSAPMDPAVLEGLRANSFLRHRDRAPLQQEKMPKKTPEQLRIEQDIAEAMAEQYAH